MIFIKSIARLTRTPSMSRFATNLQRQGLNRIPESLRFFQSPRARFIPSANDLLDAHVDHANTQAVATAYTTRRR